MSDVNSYNVWNDPSLPGVDIDHDAFLVRLKEVHGIDPATTKGTRSMRMHIDGRDWFSYVYDWEIGGKQFKQQTRTPRCGQNRRNWA